MKWSLIFVAAVVAACVQVQPLPTVKPIPPTISPQAPLLTTTPTVRLQITASPQYREPPEITPITLAVDTPFPVRELIAFDGFANSQNDRDIYLVYSNGSGLINLTNATEPDFSPAWSPDGQQLAFNATRDGKFGIYILDLVSKTMTLLTANSKGDYNAAWSPDGHYIVFNSYRGGKSSIYRIDLATKTTTQLTFSRADDWRPVWSPDGQWIAFVSHRDGNDEIYRMKPDGSDQINLTRNAADDLGPAWSPDSQTIAFFSNRNDSQNEIYRMATDGSQVTRLTQITSTGPCWASTGDKLAFSGDQAGNYGLYTMTSNGAELSFVADVADAGNCSWHP